MPKKPKKKRKLLVLDVGIGTDYSIRLDPPMGYTFDTKVKIPAAANTTTNANPVTGTVSIADDADLLVVSMIYAANTARTGGAPTANGQELTQADTARTVTEAEAELWYLTTPQPGNNVIVIPNANTRALDVFVASFKAQSGYGSAFNSASGTATTAANPNITLNVPTAQSVVISVVGHGANAWGPSSQSGTVIYNEDPAGWGGGAQFILNPPVGAVISVWTQASDDYGLVAAAFTEQQTLKSMSDVGSGSDSLSKSIQITVSDSGYGADLVNSSSQTHTEINAQVTGNENDARELANDTSFSYITGILFAHSNTSSSSRWNTGIRFTGISIPAGAIIVHSYISVNCVGVTNDDPNVDIYGGAVDNAPDFATSGDVTGRSKTTNFVTWTQTGIGTGEINSPDLTAIIQEMLDAGYLDSGVLTIFIDGKSDTNKNFAFYSYEGSPTLSVKIHIGYNIPSTTKTIDESGSSTDSLSIQAQSSLGEVGSGVDEISQILASLSIDEVSITTEIISISVSLSIPDNGTGADSESITISIPTQCVADIVLRLASGITKSVSDDGTAVDEVSQILASLGLIEIGSGIDSPEVSALLGIIDTALGGDYLDLFAGLNITETGIGIDALSQILASLSTSESGSGSDLSDILASLSISDAGSGLDSINVLTTALKTILDTGLGSDQISISVGLSLQDTGLGTDTLSIQVSLQITDTGLGADTISVIAFTLKEITDLAFGIDGVDIAASLNIGETSYGIDDPAILALLELLESGAGLDTPDISASLTITDTSFATDIISILQAFLVLISDVGSGNDVITNITAFIPVAESGIGSDAIGQILASLLVTDFGEGVDAVIKYDSTSNILTIEFILNKPRATFSLSQPVIWTDLDVPRTDIKLKTHLQ